MAPSKRDPVAVLPTFSSAAEREAAEMIELLYCPSETNTPGPLA